MWMVYDDFPASICLAIDRAVVMGMEYACVPESSELVEAAVSMPMT